MWKFVEMWVSLGLQFLGQQIIALKLIPSKELPLQFTQDAIENMGFSFTDSSGWLIQCSSRKQFAPHIFIRKNPLDRSWWSFQRLYGPCLLLFFVARENQFLTFFHHNMAYGHDYWIKLVSSVSYRLLWSCLPWLHWILAGYPTLPGG